MTRIAHRHESGPGGSLGSARDLLRGDLSATDLSEVFRFAAKSSGGTLLLRQAQTERCLHFRSGGVRIALSPREGERLGERLVRRGHLDADTLRNALFQREQQRLPLVAILGKMGTPPRDVLRRETAYQAREDICSLFTWRSGTFEFLPGGGEPGGQSRFAGLPTFPSEMLLAEVARRAAEWEKIHETIYSCNEILKARPGRDTSRLSELHARVLEALDGQRSVHDLVDATTLSLFDCARAARDLCASGFADIANAVDTIDAAETCMASGETEHAVIILEALLDRPEENNLDTVLRAATLLEQCDRPRLAGQALLLASRLCKDDDRRLELARRSCTLDPISATGLEHLRELLQQRPKRDRELIDVSRRLADELHEEDRHDEALRVLDDLLSQHPDNVDVLGRMVSILHSIGRRDEAVECLLRIADVFKAQRRPDRLVSIYEQILTIDRDQRAVARALWDLRAGKLRKRVRAFSTVGAIVLAALASLWLFSSSRSNQRERELRAAFERRLESGDVAAAFELLDTAAAEIGETEVIASLRDRAEGVVAQTHGSARVRRELARAELDELEQALHKGDLREALEHYEKLARSALGPSALRQAAREDFGALGDGWRRLCSDLRSLVRQAEAAPAAPEGSGVPDARYASDLKQAPDREGAASTGESFDDLARQLRVRALPVAESVLQLREDRALQRLLDPDVLERVLAAATEVQETGELVAKIAAQRRKIATLDRVYRQAQEAEQGSDFRRALTLYLRLANEHPNTGGLDEVFRERAGHLEQIVHHLDVIERATREGDFANANAALDRLLAAHPGVSFGSAVRLPLRVETRPTGAFVRVDGNEAGRSPALTSYVPNGTVTISIVLDGFATWERDLDATVRGHLRVILAKQPEWTFETTSAVERQPLTDDEDRVFVVDRSGRLTALELATSRTLWKFTSNDLSGLLCTPLLHREQVIVGSLDGTMVALERATGALAWQRDGLPCEGSPVLVGDLIVVGTTTGRVVGLSAGSGEPVYDYALPGPSRMRARASGSTAVLATTNGFVVAVNGTTGELAWRRQIGDGVAFSPCVEGGSVVAVSDAGRLVALRVGDGSERWSRKLDALGVRPVVAGAMVIAAAGDRLASFRLEDGETGPELVDRRPWTSELVVAGDELFAGDGIGAISVIDVKSMELRYQLSGDGTASAPVTVHGDDWVIAGFEGRQVRAFRRRQHR